MSYRTAKVGEAFYDAVTVLDFDEYTPISGQHGLDFTLKFAHNGLEVTGVVYIINEVDSSGVYSVEVPDGFDAAGFWCITCWVHYNESVWQTLVEVSEHDIDDVYDLIVGTEGMEVVILHTIDNHSVSVPDALVHVYDETGTVLITFGRTDPSGLLEITLDEDDYIVRVYKPAYNFPAYDLTVPHGGGHFDIPGSSYAVDPPPSPSLCRVYADFVTMAGEPLAGFRIRVENLYDPNHSWGTGVAVMESRREYTADDNGHIEFDVVRLTRVRVAFVGTSLSRDVVIPDEAVANLTTIFGQATDNFVLKRS